MKTAILSDGGWGSALSRVLSDNGHAVTMWGPFPAYLDEMRTTRVNSRFLKGVEFAPGIQFEPDMEVAVKDAELILLATPTQYLRSVLEKFRPFYAPQHQILLNVAKGIEEQTNLRISEMCRMILGEIPSFVDLSGPSHAEEVSRRVPTAVVAASERLELAERVQGYFMNPYFRVYTSTDVVGVELGGALKNVMAIAAGMIDGMQLGDNPKAALMTRGIAEMGRLGEALGGKSITFSGLSGIGDLIVTCCSGHSRNRHVGEELGRGKSLDAVLLEMGMVVAEGVKTTLGAWELARKVRVETPLIDEIYAVLYQNKRASDAVKDLMQRSGKSELE